jgi:hypothetical protein
MRLTVSDVPFLKKEVIEAEALSLLAEYGQVTAPCPLRGPQGRGRWRSGSRIFR